MSGMACYIGPVLPQRWVIRRNGRGSLPGRMAARIRRIRPLHRRASSDQILAQSVKICAFSRLAGLRRRSGCGSGAGACGCGGRCAVQKDMAGLRFGFGLGIGHVSIEGKCRLTLNISGMLLDDNWFWLAQNAVHTTCCDARSGVSALPQAG